MDVRRVEAISQHPSDSVTGPRMNCHPQQDINKYIHWTELELKLSKLFKIEIIHPIFSF